MLTYLYAHTVSIRNCACTPQALKWRYHNQSLSNVRIVVFPSNVFIATTGYFNGIVIHLHVKLKLSVCLEAPRSTSKDQLQNPVFCQTRDERSFFSISLNHSFFPWSNDPGSTLCQTICLTPLTTISTNLGMIGTGVQSRFR